jgi:hypothetical protein
MRSRLTVKVQAPLPGRRNLARPAFRCKSHAFSTRAPRTGLGVPASKNPFAPRRYRNTPARTIEAHPTNGAGCTESCRSSRPGRTSEATSRAPTAKRDGRIHALGPFPRRVPHTTQRHGSPCVVGGRSDQRCVRWRNVLRWGPVNLVLAYSIEYEILGLGDRPGSAGVAEVSGPASAPSPAGSGAIRGCRLLRRQWPSAPPVALQSGKFRRPADFR